jgi:NAD(P)H-hydrate epimerase
MARLLGTTLPDDPEARIEVTRQFARSYGVHLILKGARTIIAAPDGRVAINGSGNPGMASGGMGDVLTGVLTALLGQGFTPWQACQLGVFVHGLAGDLVAADRGEIGMQAGDVVEALPYAFKQLMQRNSRHHQPEPSSQK